MRLLGVTLACIALNAAAEQPAAHDCKVVHVFVPLCDNKNQGIVPVPAQLGNGQDPASNLYWGAMYGVKTFFRRSTHWKEVACAKPDGNVILDRTVFKSTETNTYVVAEAYDGARMRDALTDFLAAAAGSLQREILLTQEKLTLRGGGSANLICFAGHNGLMDVKLLEYPKAITGGAPRLAAVLACKSRQFFSEPLQNAGCVPLVLTSNFMAPEAYVLDAIVRAWADGRDADAVRRATAEAYAKYQRIQLSSAQKLFDGVAAR
jgi:hypothetical protein